MTTSKCPKCGQSSKLSFESKDYNRRITDERFFYHLCRDCRLIFLDPVPNDLGRYYPVQYYDIPESVVDLADRANRFQKSKLEVVTRFAGSGTLLEVGPAYGLFAYLAKSAGFAVTAIEQDGRCCAYLRQTVGINVVEGADTVALLKGLPKFDVIVLWQVVEHLTDSWSVLSALAEKLAPGGVLIVDTPNPESFQFGILGSRWAHVDAPRHVTLIPSALLTEHLASCGLKAVWVTSQGPIANGYNGFGWAHSLKGLFKSEAIGKFAYFVGRVVAKILAPIERTGLRGSTYTAVFTKERE